MTLNMDDLLNSIMQSLDRIDYIKPDDIPNIDLYMDQVTTFMDKRLKNTCRNPGEDKVLTKTMINNYAKNDLLPPPLKKKYSREHILILIFIYYYKGILSISDIQSLLNPLTEKFFNKQADFNLENIYEEIFARESQVVDKLKESILENYEDAKGMFEEAPEEDRDFLQMFSFICQLSFDAYVKKMLIEKLIDGLREENTGGKTGGKTEQK